MNQKITLILKTYLLALSIFTIFRVILFITELDRVVFDEVSLWTIIQAFIIGIRFDIVITGYILLLPALILLIQDISGFPEKIILKISFYWVFFLFSFSFMISAADIPYFNQFYDRFSIGAFEWIENFDFVISMILQEPKYSLILIPLTAILITLFKLLNHIFKKQKNTKPKINTYINILVSIVFLMMMFIGIRGRVQKKSPIRVGTAYFSDNSFLNKLGLNPVFTLMKSYLESKDVRNSSINFMDENKAIKKVQSYLNIDRVVYDSPIARKIIPITSQEKKPNIVVIIMESMSAAKMSRHGSKNQMTPFLDSLAKNSIYFENIYTSGKHTFNGIFSTLFSFPALYRQHSMKQIREYDGISKTLLEKGYSTTYFTTHDSQFDNVEGFLRANHFQNIIGQSNYPSKEVKTTLGVPDDYMFRYSIPVVNDLHSKNKPFFVTFMTASDHGPYYIPDYFQPNSKKIKHQIVEYADWSLKNFMKTCEKQVWFDNTIFVFIADHGTPLDAKYDISLNYFHTPLIFYAPGMIKSNDVISDIGSQIDVFPTLMGLIKQPYINNTLGIDLLKEKRKYAILNDDDKIGIIDTTYFCIMKRNEKKLQLFQYKENSKLNLYEDEKVKAHDMTEFAKSMMQTFQMMITNNKTTLKSSKNTKNKTYFQP